jgi:hypothetical protein
LENGTEKWLAAPVTAVKVGDTYYYDNFMEMKDFKSKELNRTFETIYFLEEIRNNEVDFNSQIPREPIQETQSTTGTPKIAKEEEKISVSPVSNGISLATLFADKEKYNNKIVRIKGKVVKYNPAIMGVNWIHLQDGTDYNGEFDLTVTTKAEVNINDIVTIEGKVALDKDFGAGYTYKIIVENATITNE